MSDEEIAILIEKYADLLHILEQSSYGLFLVQMHGKRPVKVWVLPAPSNLNS